MECLFRIRFPNNSRSIHNNQKYEATPPSATSKAPCAVCRLSSCGKTCLVCCLRMFVSDLFSRGKGRISGVEGAKQRLPVIL